MFVFKWVVFGGRPSIDWKFQSPSPVGVLFLSFVCPRNIPERSSNKSNALKIFQILGKNPRNVFLANSAEGVVVFKDFFQPLFFFGLADFSGLIAGTVSGCPTTLGLTSMNEQSNIRQPAKIHQPNP